jgi:hypothetical protein
MNSWQDYFDEPVWLNVLGLFTSVNDLVLGWHSIQLVTPAVGILVGDWAPATEVLPALQNLFLDGPWPFEYVKKEIRKFIAMRQASGLPVNVYYRVSMYQPYWRSLIDKCSLLYI